MHKRLSANDKRYILDISLVRLVEQANELLAGGYDLENASHVIIDDNNIEKTILRLCHSKRPDCFTTDDLDTCILSRDVINSLKVQLLLYVKARLRYNPQTKQVLSR